MSISNWGRSPASWKKWFLFSHHCLWEILLGKYFMAWDANKQIIAASRRLCFARIWFFLVHPRWISSHNHQHLLLLKKEKKQSPTYLISCVGYTGNGADPLLHGTMEERVSFSLHCLTEILVASILWFAYKKKGQIITASRKCSFEKRLCSVTGETILIGDVPSYTFLFQI